MAVRRHIFFDVNETLIDIAPLRDAVADRLGGGEDMGRRWFNALIAYSQAATVIRSMPAFSDIAAAVLVMLAGERGEALPLEEAKRLVGKGLAASQPWPDVKDALARLREADFELIALTNSGQDGLAARLDRCGIAPYFSRMLSVQPAGAYKPDPRCYRRGLAIADAAADRSLMVACHPWDLMGARRVGMGIAFVERPGTAWYPLADEPDYRAPTLQALADTLIAR